MSLPTAFFCVPANFTSETRILLFASLIFSFWAAVESRKLFTALFSAFIFVVPVDEIGSSMEPETSSTSTISTGVTSWLDDDVELPFTLMDRLYVPSVLGVSVFVAWLAAVSSPSAANALAGTPAKSAVTIARHRVSQTKSPRLAPLQATQAAPFAIGASFLL